MRCPGCDGVFYFFVHGNGAVELRSVDDEPVAATRLPPRAAEQGETKGARTIFTSRRRKRPIGGYLPFEKSRSYIGTFVFVGALGLVSMAAYLYFQKIDTISKAQGRSEKNAFVTEAEAKRKAHEKKVQRALEAQKKQKAKAQQDGAKVEDGRLPGG
jgi:hypothetical protein